MSTWKLVLIPNKPIKAGKTKGATAIEASPDASLSVPNPQPATLGVLALGSAGLPMWRREESLDAKQ